MSSIHASKHSVTVAMVNTHGCLGLSFLHPWQDFVEFYLSYFHSYLQLYLFYSFLAIKLPFGLGS